MHKNSDKNDSVLPKHVAVVMDGNGRWAKQRNLPRVAGHKAGVEALRKTVQCCGESGIPYLTIFAFSSENWRRPKTEVNFLMKLFVTRLHGEAKKLHEHNIRIRFMGDRSRFTKKLQQEMLNAETLTEKNTRMTLIVAMNYGGQWDICHAFQKIAVEIENGKLSSQDIRPELIQTYIGLDNVPNPDLYIRTSGEQRISNFMLWQLAYTELYFTNVLWPDFDAAEFKKALEFFTQKERRFGYISEQLQVNENA